MVAYHEPPEAAPYLRPCDQISCIQDQIFAQSILHYAAKKNLDTRKKLKEKKYEK